MSQTNHKRTIYIYIYIYKIDAQIPTIVKSAEDHAGQGHSVLCQITEESDHTVLFHEPIVLQT